MCIYITIKMTCNPAHVSFSTFKITNHEEVISQTLTSEEVRTKVLNFLSKVTSEICINFKCIIFFLLLCSLYRLLYYFL